MSERVKSEHSPGLTGEPSQPRRSPGFVALRTPGPVRWMQGRFAGFWLAALCLAVLIPGFFTLPPIDRDECRFAQASRQMFEAAAWPASRLTPAFHSGGWAVPMVQDAPRLNKPPLIYWLQTASAWVFTAGRPEADAIWMYRLPSALSMLLSVLITWRLGRAMMDPRAAWLAAALLAVCPLVAFDAHQARADQLLLLSVVGMQWCLWHLWRAAQRNRAPWRGFLGFWLFAAMSVLSKGPIGPMVVGLTVAVLLALSRAAPLRRALRPALGVSVVILLVVPWVAAVASKVGLDKYLGIITGETLGRSVEAKEGHWGPPGYHTLLAAALFWPGSLLTFASVARAFKRGLTRRPSATRSGGIRNWLRSWAAGRPAEFFLLAWLVPGWIVFELIGTKLPHYTMPMYPALALITARGVFAAASHRLHLARGLLTLGVLAWGAIGIVIAVAGIVAFRFARLTWTDPVPVGTALASIFLAGSGPMLWAAFRDANRKKFVRSALASLVAAALALGSLFGLAGPRVVGVSELIAARLHALDPLHARPCALAGYQEDSLVFATRGHARRITDDQVAQWCLDHPDGLIVISERLRDQTPEPLRAAGSVFEGLNLGKGRRETVRVIDLAQPNKPALASAD